MEVCLPYDTEAALALLIVVNENNSSAVHEIFIYCLVRFILGSRPGQSLRAGLKPPCTHDR